MNLAMLVEAQLRLAFRCAEAEAKTGRWPEIEQVDVDLLEDASGVCLWAYDTAGESYLATVPFRSPDDAKAFDIDVWKDALNA
jgi:hypothetical protein